MVAISMKTFMDTGLMGRFSAHRGMGAIPAASARVTPHCTGTPAPGVENLSAVAPPGSRDMSPVTQGRCILPACRKKEAAAPTFAFSARRFACMVAASMVLSLPAGLGAAQALPAGPGPQLTCGTAPEAVMPVPSSLSLRSRSATAVTVSPLRARGSEVSRQSSMKERLSEAVTEILTNSPGPLSSVEGACMDFSALWLEPLRSRGIPAMMALTDSSLGASEVTLKDGTRLFFHKFHAFITVKDGDRELILDPTWKQFVADKDAARELPDVLTGTAEELREVYAKVDPQLQLETTGADPHQGDYDITSATDLLYSSGSCGHLRMMLE